jgi:phosphoserine aminotransferase
MGERIYFTPGPTQLHPAVGPAMRRALDEGVASLSHRSPEFQQVFKRTTRSLRGLLGIPDSHELFFLSSGTECMERVIQNCVEKRSLHLVNGAFSGRFCEIAVALGKAAIKEEVAWGEGFDVGALAIRDEVELLCITQNETSSGVLTDLRGLAELRERYPELLVAVDMVSAAPSLAADFEMIDCAFFSVQKGFGMPAGLAVLSASPRAVARSRSLQEKGVAVGSYHSFPSLAAKAGKHQTPETPNVLAIHLLGEVCDALAAQGIAAIREETERKAALLYSALEEQPQLSPFVANRLWRSPTVIVGEVAGGSRPVIERLASQGMMVGAGYGKLKERQLRIANFPAHTLSQVEKLTIALGVKSSLNVGRSAQRPTKT